MTAISTHSVTWLSTHNSVTLIENVKNVGKNSRISEILMGSIIKYKISLCSNAGFIVFREKLIMIYLHIYYQIIR